MYDLVGDFLLGYSLWHDSTSSDISRRLAMLAILTWSALRSAWKWKVMVLRDS